MSALADSPAIPSTRAADLLVRGRALLREVIRRPSGFVGLLIVGGLVFVVAFASWIAPSSSAHMDIVRRFQGPSSRYLLGTDQFGRDLLSRLMFGARIALEVSIPAVAIALMIGLLLGLLAGYLGRVVDNILVVVMDTLQAFPAVILALALLALVGPSSRNLILAIAIAFTPTYARVSRALTYQAKQQPYVEAERALGASRGRILRAHILPNILPPLFILMAMDIPGAILAQAGLTFLGLGLRPPTPLWGVILPDGFTNVRQSPWAGIWASLALMYPTPGLPLAW